MISRPNAGGVIRSSAKPITRTSDLITWAAADCPRIDVELAVPAGGSFHGKRREHVDPVADGLLVVDRLGRKVLQHTDFRGARRGGSSMPASSSSRSAVRNSCRVLSTRARVPIKTAWVTRSGATTSSPAR